MAPKNPPGSGRKKSAGKGTRKPASRKPASASRAASKPGKPASRKAASASRAASKSGKPASSKAPPRRGAGQRASRRGRASRSFWRRAARRAVYLAAVAGVWAAVLLAGAVGVLAIGLPDIDRVAAEPRRPGITVTDAHGAVVANFGQVYGAYAPPEELPQTLIDAVLSVEDRRFHDHSASTCGDSRAPPSSTSSPGGWCREAPP